MEAKDPDAESQDLGKMIVKTFAPALSTAAEDIALQAWPGIFLSVRRRSEPMHPDHVFGKMTVTRAGDLVFHMEGGGSISANPYFRFTFGRATDNSLEVAITDTAGAVFSGRSLPSGS
jgi:sulfur-oxidizing protein SoxY